MVISYTILVILCENNALLNTMLLVSEDLFYFDCCCVMAKAADTTRAFFSVQPIRGQYPDHVITPDQSEAADTIRAFFSQTTINEWSETAAQPTTEEN